MSKFCDTCINEGTVLLCLPNLPTNHRKETKPPLGLTPKYIWEAQRVQAISEAMDRYMSANKAIPLEWIQEYNNLIK